MPSLKIVATGNSEKQRNAKKGKLFENIIAEVLKAQGYSIDDHTSNVNYSGMEIDIEGSAKLAGTPMYAECKCYSTDVSAEKLQTFFGKYMTRWFKDDKCHGLFIALPGVNSHAIGFYNDNCKSNPKITIRLLQEPKILDILIESGFAKDIKHIQQSIDLNLGSLGDSVLVYTENGPMWVQYLIPIGSTIATRIILFDASGRQIIDESSVEYLVELLPELSEFEVALPPKNKTVTPKRLESTEEIVELRGSS